MRPSAWPPARRALLRQVRVTQTPDGWLLTLETRDGIVLASRVIPESPIWDVTTLLTGEGIIVEGWTKHLRHGVEWWTGARFPG